MKECGAICRALRVKSKLQNDPNPTQTNSIITPKKLVTVIPEALSALHKENNERIVRLGESVTSRRSVGKSVSAPRAEVGVLARAPQSDYYPAMKRLTETRSSERTFPCGRRTKRE